MPGVLAPLAALLAVMLIAGYGTERVFAAPPIPPLLLDQSLSYTPRSFTSCEKGLCTTTMFQDPRFYQLKNGTWIQIDENFYANECPPGYAFCTKPDAYYQFSVPAKPGNANMTANGKNLTFKLAKVGGITYFPNLFVTTVSGNTVEYNYTAAKPPFGIRYTYLPQGPKEEVIVYDKTLFTGSQFNLTYNINDIGNGNVIAPIACDDRECVSLPYISTKTSLVYTVNATWAKEASGNVVIDPSVVVEPAFEDVRVRAQEVPSLLYSRFGTTAGFQIGKRDEIAPSPVVVYDRSEVEWNITASVPASAKIVDFIERLYVQGVGNASNNNWNATHMDGVNATYDPATTGECQENCEFFADMGNGTVYLAFQVQAATGSYSFNFSSALADINRALNGTTVIPNGAGEWAHGLKSAENSSTGVNAQFHEFSSKNHGTPSRRPNATATYILPPNVTLPVFVNGTQRRNDESVDISVFLTFNGGSASSCFVNVATAAQGNVSITPSSSWCNTTYDLTGSTPGNRTISAYANDTENLWGFNDSYVVNVTNTCFQPVSGDWYIADTCAFSTEVRWCGAATEVVSGGELQLHSGAVLVTDEFRRDSGAVVTREAGSERRVPC